MPLLLDMAIKREVSYILSPNFLRVIMSCIWQPRSRALTGLNSCELPEVYMPFLWKKRKMEHYK